MKPSTKYAILEVVGLLVVGTAGAGLNMMLGGNVVAGSVVTVPALIAAAAIVSSRRRAGEDAAVDNIPVQPPPEARVEPPQRGPGIPSDVADAEERVAGLIHDMGKITLEVAQIAHQQAERFEALWTQHGELGVEAAQQKSRADALTAHVTSVREAMMRAPTPAPAAPRAPAFRDEHPADAEPAPAFLREPVDLDKMRNEIEPARG